MLDAGADVNQNTGGFSALTQAAEIGNIGILKLLTSKGAEQQSVQNAFVVAAEKNQVNAMRFLMSLAIKPDLNKKKQSLGSTPLIEAAKNDAYEAVRYLIAKGANINLVEREDFDFDSPLTIAARNGNQAMVNYLLNLGANSAVGVRTGTFGSDGEKTALDFAADKSEVLKTLQKSIAPQQIAGNLEFLKFMINAGDLAYEQKLPEAVAEYNRSLAIYPDSNNIYLPQIPLTITLKDFASAGQTAGKVLAVCQKAQAQCNPATLAEAHNFRVVALIRLQKFEAALFDADKAVEFCVKGEKPCSFLGSIYNNRGVIYREKKMFKEALADLNKAIEIMPQTGRPYFHRARTHYLIGDFDKATADLTKARKLDATDEEIKTFQITREQAARNKTNSTN